MATRSTKKVTAPKAAPAKRSAANRAPKKAVKKAVNATRKAPKKAARAARKATTTPVSTSKKPTTKKAPAKAVARKTASTETAASVGKAASKRGPAKRKSPFPARFLTKQQKALESERATYTRQALSLRAEADALVADFEPGDVQFDEESGEGDTLNIERERDLTLSAQAQRAVEEIDHALAKFADGTYGLCEISGDPIPEERLEAIPWARERVEYKTGGLGRR